MFSEALFIVLKTEPVLMTLVTLGAKGREDAVTRRTSLGVAETEQGYVIVGIDAEDGSIVCTSSLEAEYRLTPLEAVQLLRTLDGIQVITLTGAYSDEAVECNQLIRALRGSLNEYEMDRLADKFWAHPKALLLAVRSIPAQEDMDDLMARYSTDRGLAFFMSARCTVGPAMQKLGLISREELWWIDRLTVVLVC